MNKKNNLYIVIPCYNEEEIIEKSINELTKVIKNLINKKLISKNSKIFIVDDGSTDNTFIILKRIIMKNNYVHGVSLSRNYGHQNALMCGMNLAVESADMIITIDADLQDDISVIEEMLLKHFQGNEVVYGIRKSRKKDDLFKRTTAQLFYRLMLKLGIEIEYNHADFRLLDKRIVNELNKFEERNLFLRGIIPLVGFKSDKVYYERKERGAGKSKYPLKKMINFALDGITSFSIKPIRLVFALGIIIFFLSIIMVIYSVAVKLFGKTVSGWTFIVSSIWLIAGIQMISLGIIGEYIGKIYSETKKRPRYIIKEELKKTNKND